MISNDAGADPEAIKVSFHVAGDVVSAWVRVAVGAIASAASWCAISAAMVVVENERAKLLFCCVKCDLNPDSAFGLLTLIDSIRLRPNTTRESRVKSIIRCSLASSDGFVANPWRRLGKN